MVTAHYTISALPSDPFKYIVLMVFLLTVGRKIMGQGVKMMSMVLEKALLRGRRRLGSTIEL